MSGFRVLVVDDEPDIRESIGMTLQAIVPDVKLEVAADGVQALKVLEEKGADLILSDYRMPNMDGIEFLAKAKELYPDVPRLLITAFPDPELAVKAVQEAGVGLFIAKPFDPAYIGEVLKAFALKDK